MKGKALFAVGVAVGYVWGSKSWPEVYRRIRNGGQKVWHNPNVQENVHHAAETVEETVPDILDNLYAAGKKLIEKAETMFPGIIEPRPAQQGTRAQHGATAQDGAPPRRNDVVSDPALDDQTGSDWTDEGGAAPEGPATTTPPRA
ncbi:hypothetical protein ACIQC5_17475 [Paenarthrobacter sp. NPDC092416]|uniref:hypothetical protein n=1 Tax=Paenarthrobacter sp. NPDC092416 TaxID=3364386 RepID=UPI00381B7499